MFSNFKKFFSRTPQKNEVLHFHEIYQPFQYILTMVGLFPCSIRYNHLKRRYTITKNSIYINSLCAVSCLMIMYAFFFIHVKEIYSANEVNSLTNVLITQLNYLVEISSLLVYCTVAYISAFLYRYKYVKILNSVCSYWVESNGDSRNEILGRLRFQVNVVAIGTLSFLLILQICVNVSRDDSTWKIILVTFTFIMPQMIQMIGLAFHYTLVMMMVSILANINQQLLSLNNQRKNSNFILTKVEAKASSIPLKKVQVSYGKAFEIKNDINEAFQASILITALQSIHCVVSEGYTIYHGMVANTHTVHNVINNTIWTMYQFLKIYSLAYSGNTLMMEATKIGQNLHCIPVEKQDLRTFLEIQHFSTSMQYQDFALSVYGYFTLGANLMASMVATVTMYLIVLVQFDKSQFNTKVVGE